MYSPNTYAAPYPQLSNSNQINFPAQLSNGSPVCIIVPTGHASSLALEEIRRRTGLECAKKSDTLRQLLWSKSRSTNNLESFFDNHITRTPRLYVPSFPYLSSNLPYIVWPRKGGGDDESNWYKDPYDLKKGFYHNRKHNRHSKYLPAMGECEKGERFPDLTLESEIARKRTTKESRWTSRKGKTYNKLSLCLRRDLRSRITRISDPHEEKNRSHNQFGIWGGVRHSREQLYSNVSSATNGEEHECRSRAGVKLSRPGYYCIPDLEALDNLVNPESGDCLVEDFEIGHVDYGSLVFNGIINLAGLDLDSIIEFSDMSLELTEDDRLTATPATVTLKNVCSRTGTNKDSSEMMTSLNKACKRFNGRHISYDHLNRIWIFRINERPLVNYDENDPI